jgi:DNA-directed RNA polymerase specialized sigma24 family protein
MKGVPGTLQEGGAAFASTHWSVVLLTAQSQAPEAAQAAMTGFCQTYWPPLYTFLRRRGRSPSDAQDLVQAFFAHLLEQNTLARASREKGKLRTFLLGSLQHFLANEHAYAQAAKRGGGQQIVSMDDHLIEAEAAMLHTAQTDATNGYDRQWAADLVSRAWDQVHRDMVAEGKRELIEALKPFVVGGTETPPDQEQTATQLQMPISTFRNHLRRLRLRYRESLRAEVARTVSNISEADEEMRYLLRVLVS